MDLGAVLLTGIGVVHVLGSSMGLAHDGGVVGAMGLVDGVAHSGSIAVLDDLVAGLVGHSDGQEARDSDESLQESKQNNTLVEGNTVWGITMFYTDTST